MSNETKENRDKNISVLCVCVIFCRRLLIEPF